MSEFTPALLQIPITLTLDEVNQLAGLAQHRGVNLDVMAQELLWTQLQIALEEQKKGQVISDPAQNPAS